MPVLPNQRHERFAQELAKGKTATEAYVEAGYKPNDGNAATLKGNQRVMERVAEIQERGAIRAEVTVASILDELEIARKLAIEIKQPSAAVSASMGRAKVRGLISDKIEHTGKDGGPIETSDVSARETIERRIAGLAARGPASGGVGKPH